MSSFSYEAKRRGGVAQIALAGELDMSATFQLEPELDRLLDARDVREIVLDLGDVEFVDSSGMGLLMATLDRTRESNTRVALVSVRPEVRRVFQIAGLDEVLPLSP
jgi:anti-anti-sigma factor